MKAAEIMRPEHKQAFADVRITRNIVAQHVKSTVENFRDKLLVALSVAANENMDVNHSRPLAIFMCDVERILEGSKNF